MIVTALEESPLKCLNLSYNKTVNFAGNETGGCISGVSLSINSIPASVVFETIN
ncbi:hypothetical protein D3C85_1693250 [compost metagenome]